MENFPFSLGRFLDLLTVFLIGLKGRDNYLRIYNLIPIIIFVRVSFPRITIPFGISPCHIIIILSYHTYALRIGNSGYPWYRILHLCLIFRLNECSPYSHQFTIFLTYLFRMFACMFIYYVKLSIKKQKYYLWDFEELSAIY